MSEIRLQFSLEGTTGACPVQRGVAYPSFSHSAADILSARADDESRAMKMSSNRHVEGILPNKLLLVELLVGPWSQWWLGMAKPPWLGPGSHLAAR